MDYSRQMEIFVPDTFKHDVHVIGCGATGSWVAMMLAKMGIRNLHIHDFDTVEEHNLPNQLFEMIDVGRSKVSAAYSRVSSATDIKPKIYDERVTGETELSGIVFLLTDTMTSRAEIFKKAIRNNLSVPLLIETRMGLEGGRVYALNPCDKKQVELYLSTMYTDDEAVVSACGISQSLAPTAAIMAGLAVWQLLKFHANEQIDNEILIDAKHNTYLTRRF